MSAGKKYISIICIIGLIAVLSLSLFSGCDNRKAINSKVSGTQYVSISLSPTALVRHSSVNPDTVEIAIRVRDSEGNGIDSVQVSLYRTPEIGTIEPPDLTDNGGYATALFVTDTGEEHDSLITFVATSGSNADTVELDVTNAFPAVSMSLLPPELTIHSRYDADTVAIDIRVRDADGNGIDSVEVDMARTPEIGTIDVDEYTSTGGLATGYFITDPGLEKDTTVIISATVGTMVDIDTLSLAISLQGEIDTMYISLEKTSLLADGEDQTAIYVSVLDTTGVPIGDGTEVTIERKGALYGGVLDSTTTSTNNGIATFTLTAPSIIDSSVIVATDTLIAYAQSESGDYSYVRTLITYRPGSPATLDITSEPYDMISGSSESQEISCTVYDENGNYVMNGTQIRYMSSLSTSDITSLTTTQNGAAVAIYTVGTESGYDEVRAFYNQPGSTDTLWSDAVSIYISSSFPTNISLTTTAPEIMVGGSSTIIKATMQDENGNPLSEGFNIKFEITAAPSMNIGEDTPSFRYVPTPDSVNLETTEYTNVNGVAAVTLFSGNKSGTVKIKATSVDDENIFKEKPLVTIQSGPPFWIEIMQSNIADVDEEALITGITAAVWDTFANPVEPMTAVYFSVLPETIAYIYGFAYTGGYPNPEDETDTIGISGQASTWLSYPCDHTFDTVRVTANSGELYDTSGAIVLALYDGQITLDANPGVLYVASGDTGYADMTALLQDGLGCPIHYGIILFSASGCGWIGGQTIDTTDSDGYAYTIFGIGYSQIPDRESPLPPGCDATVTAKLRGYSDVEAEASIFCTVL